MGWLIRSFIYSFSSQGLNTTTPSTVWQQGGKDEHDSDPRQRGRQTTTPPNVISARKTTGGAPVTPSLVFTSCVDYSHVVPGWSVWPREYGRVMASQV